MSDIPDAKRVRREDLLSPAESDVDEVEQDADLEAQINAQIAKALGISEHDTSNRTKDIDMDLEQDNNEQTAGDENDEDGYEFNLFSTGGSLPKVVLAEDPALGGDGALLRPRPLSHYATLEITDKQKKQFEFAAVSADDVLLRAKIPSWGMQLPWKVRTIAMTRKAKPGENGNVEMLEEIIEDENKKKKKRPGKKTRIVLRERQKAKEARQANAAKQKEEAAKKMAEKDEHIKDKKKRLNRIKKLRKRAKDKEKKLATQGGNEGDEADSDGASSGGGSGDDE